MKPEIKQAKRLLAQIGTYFGEFDLDTPELQRLNEQIEKNFEKYGKNGEHIPKQIVNSKENQ